MFFFSAFLSIILLHDMCSFVIVFYFIKYQRVFICPVLAVVPFLWPLKDDFGSFRSLRFPVFHICI